MSLTIVDKRKVTRDRSTENRQRFLRRIKGTIKDQLPKIINGRTLEEMDKAGGKVRVSRKTIREPWFHHGPGGNIDRVLPGNKDYVPDDLIDKPQGGGGSRGRGASNSDETSEDDFIVELSREEFLQSFFEDLELPDMVKLELSRVKEVVRENAGYQTDGSPNKLAILRSYKNSFARRRAVTAGIEEQLEDLRLKLLDPEGTDAERDLTQAQILELQSRLENLPLFEEIDLRYRATQLKQLPSTHATMILVMDVSGSMGEREKTIARKFFWLLYKFLKLSYDQIDLRFVTHTVVAREMDEEEFFSTRETGGTLVSSALDEVAAIINGDGESYTGDSRASLIGKTNIYVAQVTDGDNMSTDNGTCTEILEEDILPNVQYFSYIQIDDGSAPSLQTLINMDNGLWKSYSHVSSAHSKLQCRRVFDEKDIYPVFHGLFKRKG